MSVFSFAGRFWRISPFTDEVEDLGPLPTPQTRYTRITHESGEVSLYCVKDDIGPHPHIFEGFIEVGDGRFVSVKDVKMIETWSEDTRHVQAHAPAP